MADKTVNPATLIKIGSDNGHTIINKNSQLRRLNYFDGKFLRAPDLILEQQALLNQIRQSNQAGGGGVVHGYDCTLGNGDNLQIGSGFAIDFSGRVLLLNDAISVGIQELIEKSRSAFGASASAAATQPETTISRAENASSKAGFDDCVIHASSALLDGVDNNDLYLITINHTEAYCGQEDVFGKLCSEACSTSTSHSYIIEGIEVRAVPLNLSKLLKTSSAVALSQLHLRSRVAAAFFAEERERVASHISAAGLTSMIWCLGAEAANGNGIPIAVLGRNGGTTLFLDAWTARRERMETPPRHYWAGRMAMRPWYVFLAQILQFQCQLRGCLTSRDPDAPCKPLKEFDPCADTRLVARKAAEGMRYLIDSMSQAAQQLAEFNGSDILSGRIAEFEGGVTRLEQQYQALIDSGRIVVPNRLLINCGIVEVPSAGYLPVNASSTVSVNEQVERLLGEGLDLRFCVVRPDFVAHALEEAQHMDRICLLSGIDDPANKPRVDVLVPNGEIQQLENEELSTGYVANAAINSEVFALGWPRRIKTTITGTLDQPAGLSINTNIEALSVNRRLLATAATDLPALSGAARGEQLETSGYGFYLATRSGEKSLVGAATLATAQAASQYMLELLDGRDSAAANINMARLSSGLRINAAATKVEGLKISRLVPSAAMWLDLKTERDPFNLNVGEVTDVRARMTMIVSNKFNNVSTLIIEERSVSGQLHIEKSAPQKADTKFSARLVANGIWTETRIVAGNSQTRSEPVKFDETVIVSRSALTGLPPTVSIAIVNPSFFGNLSNVQLVFERVWSSPTESRVRSLLRYQGSDQFPRKGDFGNAADLGASAGLQVKPARFEQLRGGRETVLAEINLREDQTVLSPGNQYHSAALSALSTIGKATEDTGFSDQAGKLLFPPPQPVLPELRILAREPWVLFHRRRDKVCAAAAAQEVAIKPRSYRVYHIHLASRIDIDELSEALQADASGVITRFNASPVTVVDYAPGLATVTSARADVRADWQAEVKVDADVHIGLIASEGDVINDGEALADNRLQSLTDLLAPVSKSADDLSLLSINEVPPTLAAGEVDGVIVYFTKAVVTVCHSVYRIVSNSSDTIIERLQVYLRQPSGDSLPSFVQKLGAQVLPVNPRFSEGGDTYFGTNEAQQLASAWDLVDDGPVSKAVSIGSDATDELKLVTRQQTSRISQTVGTPMSPDSVSYLDGPAGIFKPCPRVSLLMAETDCNDLYVFTPPAQDHASLVEKLTKLIADIGFPANTLGTGTAATNVTTSMITRFASVDFYRATDQFEASSRQQFLLKWQSELSGNPPAGFNGFYLAIARSAATAEETAANLAEARKQGEKLQQLMGINSSGVFPVTNAADAQFPVDCKVFTLLIIPRDFGLLAGNLTHAVIAINTATASSGDTTAQPAMALELARNVSFDENNEVVRDANFNTVLEKVIANEAKVKSLELVSVESTSDADAKARAKALLKVLKDEGVANNNAKLVVRVADASERAEIFRSGFLLDRGMVLR